MNTVAIPVTKKVTTEVPNGHIEIIDRGDCYQVKYYNSIYKGSPFSCPTAFSKDHTVNQIVNSFTIQKFLRRFQ